MRILKNIQAPASLGRIALATELQSKLAMACLKNSLTLKTQLSWESNGLIFHYDIWATNDIVGKPVITGLVNINKLYKVADYEKLAAYAHYSATLSLANGEMVSIFTPPCFSKELIGDKIPRPVYWKRQSVTVIDHVSMNGALTPVGVTTYNWAGFTKDHVPMIHIPEGTRNEKLVDEYSIHYQMLGDKGEVVTVDMSGPPKPVNASPLVTAMPSSGPTMSVAGSAPTSYSSAGAVAAPSRLSTIPSKHLGPEKI